MERAKFEEFSEREKQILYRTARMCNENILEDICDDLLDVIMGADDVSAIKATALGLSIFRLLNTDSLATYVGLQRLLEAGMMIDPEKILEILENYNETAIADELRSLI
ncbi:MAG: hypothetical protein ACTSUE_10020 [Promethearchaeota archaeon]